MLSGEGGRGERGLGIERVVAAAELEQAAAPEVALDAADGGLEDVADVARLQVSELLGVPTSSFGGGGNRTAIQSQLDAVEADVLAGKIDKALKRLQSLRKHLDGRGATPDGDDWIVDCEDQLAVRAGIDLLIDNLDG